MRFMVFACPSAEREPAEVLEAARDEHPDDRDRDEHLPAEPHDLVVAVAREACAEPDVRGREEEHLEEEPTPAALPDPFEEPRTVAVDQALERARPAAEEQDRREERDENHV